MPISPIVSPISRLAPPLSGDGPSSVATVTKAIARVFHRGVDQSPGFFRHVAPLQHD
jgi:hypothetical protein